jgi:hypothetical protein
MNVKVEMKNFYEEVKARVKGDTAEVKVLKITNRAKEVLQEQSELWAHKLTKAKRVLRTALDMYDNAIYPSDLITNDEDYLSTIKINKAELEEAQFVHDEAVEQIAYYEHLLTSFGKVVAE